MWGVELRASNIASALRETWRGHQRREYLVIICTFKTTVRRAAALLIWVATSAISANGAAVARDFDPAPVELERRMDSERSEAKTWCDRDFDFSNEIDDHQPGPSAARDFDPVDRA